MESFAKIVKGCIYFCNISFSRFLLYEIKIMIFSGLVFTPELFILCKKVWGPRGLWAVDFDIPFPITAFQQSKRTERPFGSLHISIKNLIEYIWIFVTFQQLLETAKVESFLSTLADLLGSFPQVFCKANLWASASVKQDLHSWRYLRSFSEFQKCTRLKSVVFDMQFT